MDLARARAGGARFLVAVEDTGLEPDYFDRVTGKWILHHADVSAAAREIARVLKPDGHAAFFENQGRNPLLRLARRVLWRLPAGEVVGTPDSARSARPTSPRWSRPSAPSSSRIRASTSSRP